MKRLVFAVGILAFLLMGQAGFAKTLEEVLKEKGVITEADFKEVTVAKPVAYQPGKGFTFTSPDGKFQLSLGGRGKFFYQYLDRDDANGAANEVSLSRIRAFKIYMGGYAYTKNLTYRVQVDLAKSGTAQMMEDAWINYRFLDEAQLQAGQFKMPFSRGELTSDGALQFVDRANAVDTFKPSYDIGAMVQGKTAGGKLAYNAGLFNGTGQSGTRTTNSGAWAARVVFNPFGEMRYSEADLENSPSPLLSLGASYFANTLKRNANATFLDTSHHDSRRTPGPAGGSGRRPRTRRSSTTRSGSTSGRTDSTLRSSGGGSPRRANISAGRPTGRIREDRSTPAAITGRRDTSSCRSILRSRPGTPAWTPTGTSPRISRSRSPAPCRTISRDTT